MPINLATINQFYGADLRPGDVGAFLRAKIAPIDHPRNLEEKAVSLIGRELYEAFIKGYTVKQWDCDPAALPPEIITRLPVRSSYYDSYFDDAYQGMPVNGYTPIFERLLEGIPVELKTDYFDRKDHWRSLCDTLVYTGPLDAYFDYQCGRLRWRSVRFEPELYPLDDFQGTSVMNYADLDVAYTRIHEPKHLHRERSHRQGQTLVIREYPCDNPREPYYPVNRTEDQAVLARYQELRKNEHGVIFGGRLAEYRYYDMHEVIAAALTRARSVLGAAGDLQQGNES